jgi:hypothetical protein
MSKLRRRHSRTNWLSKTKLKLSKKRKRKTLRRRRPKRMLKKTSVKNWRMRPRL